MTLCTRSEREVRLRIDPTFLCAHRKHQQDLKTSIQNIYSFSFCIRHRRWFYFCCASFTFLLYLKIERKKERKNQDWSAWQRQQPTIFVNVTICELYSHIIFILKKGLIANHAPVIPKPGFALFAPSFPTTPFPTTPFPLLCLWFQILSFPIIDN